MTLLGAGLGAIQPVAQATFTNSSYSTNLSNLTSIATFSRAGNAMQFDSSGYLTYGPNNLLTYTATLSTQSVTVVVGVNYILSIKGTGSVTLTGASTAGPLNGTGASNRVDLKITAATTSLTLTVAGSVTSARLSAVTYETAFRTCDDVDTTSAAYYGPRFDYTYNGSSWVPAGLLVEGAATNLAINSSALTGGDWALGGATRTSDATLDLTGATAVKLAASAGAGGHLVASSTANISVTSGTAYTQSWYVKAGTWSKVSVNVGYPTNWSAAVFDISGTADVAATQVAQAADTGGAGTSKYLGGGWFRVTLKFTAGATGNRCTVIAFAGALTGNVFNAYGDNVFAAAGTETIYIGQPQFELGTSASSYIPTGASAVTRAAETVQLTGTALSTLQGASGTAIVQTTDYPGGSATGILIGGDNNTAYPLAYSSNQGRTYNGFTGMSTANPATLTSPARVGVAWSAAGRSLSLNGGAVATDAGGFWSAQTAFYLGSYAVLAGFSNNHFASLALYNSRLPDATLQTKSVVGAAY